MYSTKLVKNRFKIICIALVNQVSGLELVVDTGARYTCCNYKFIDTSLREDDFVNCEKKELTGFVKGKSLIFYKYHVRQFTIGNIDIGSQDIWITFDDLIGDAVLGMDLLSKISFLHIENISKLLFFKDTAELYQFTKSEDVKNLAAAYNNLINNKTGSQD